MHESTCIVVQGASVGDVLKFGADLCHLCTGHILGQVPGVRADIAYATSFSGCFGIVAPYGIVPSFQFDALGELALRIFHEGAAYFADVSTRPW